MSKKNTSEIFIERAVRIHGNKYDYSDVNYTHSKIKVEIICKKHGVFLQEPRLHLSKKGCPECGKIRHIRLITKTTEQFIDDAIKIHGNTYDYSKVNYIHSKIKVEIICKKHGIFLQTPPAHLNKRGCPNCNFSKGEYLIEKLLIKNNITFIRQKRFSKCKNKYSLPFDFYLPDHKICIEYDGIQHFEPIKQFGGLKGYTITQKHDKIKNNYCSDNGIKLIRIPYWEKDNIKKILSYINLLY